MVVSIQVDIIMQTQNLNHQAWTIAALHLWSNWLNYLRTSFFGHDLDIVITVVAHGLHVKNSRPTQLSTGTQILLLWPTKTSYDKVSSLMSAITTKINLVVQFILVKLFKNPKKYKQILVLALLRMITVGCGYSINYSVINQAGLNYNQITKIHRYT